MYVPKVRLLKSLLFRDAHGIDRIVSAGAIVDGRSMPALFVKLMGFPFEGVIRKSAISHYRVAETKNWG